MPEGDHYVVIEFSTMHIPADGPDYPAHSAPNIKYITFPTKEDWENEIKFRAIRDGDKKSNFIAGRIVRAKFERQVTVSIEPV